MIMRICFPIAAILALSACTLNSKEDTETFWTNLQALCGNAYAGEMLSNDEADADWRGKEMIMHVRTCTDTEVRIPLHVGDDRSRTWVLKRDGKQLELRHDHRHEDGSEDALTQYGGFNTAASSHTHQSFPADAATKALFDAEDIPVSKENVWTIQIIKDDSFTYQLMRQRGTRAPTRDFRARFDTTKPLDTLPPAPWGHE